MAPNILTVALKRFQVCEIGVVEMILMWSNGYMNICILIFLEWEIWEA